MCMNSHGIKRRPSDPGCTRKLLEGGCPLVNLAKEMSQLDERFRKQRCGMQESETSLAGSNLFTPIAQTESSKRRHVELKLVGGLAEAMAFQQRRECQIVPGRSRRIFRQESVRKAFRRRSGSPGPRRASTAAWVLVHTGTARVSNFLPSGVNSSRRARWSLLPLVILIRLRRRSGFRAAVKVVRSIASNDATAPIVGGPGRFKDIIRENCPLVRPSGRSAVSKRRASARAARSTCRQRQESRTRIVVS